VWNGSQRRLNRSVQRYIRASDVNYSDYPVGRASIVSTRTSRKCVDTDNTHTHAYSGARKRFLNRQTAAIVSDRLGGDRRHAIILRTRNRRNSHRTLTDGTRYLSSLYRTYYYATRGAPKSKNTAHVAIAFAVTGDVNACAAIALSVACFRGTLLGRVRPNRNAAMRRTRKNRICDACRSHERKIVRRVGFVCKK